ncbi:MAG TPA: nicotinate (nicotinamide) nucleotide adenylyltransferase [Desulfuromonadales bacterium]|nr:nicotinate (nicotinamide) nucleotide adenylyltransferase [Desulfuromonadales bacterium]
MKVGLLGGSFNPVHNAHLQVAAEARSACLLDRVIFIPTADPPHKPLAGGVSFEIRSAMVKLAIAGRADYEISTIEAERPGKSYSIDTIRAFRQRCPDDDLFFIIGGDSFAEIGLWHRYADIFCECNLIVAERPGCRLNDPLEALPDAVRGKFRLNEEEKSLLHESGHLVKFIRGTPLDLSSTEIRRKAAEGADISSCVPFDVAHYISLKRIYKK